MKKLSRFLSLEIPFLVAANLSIYGQATRTPSVQQKSERSICANVVALVGDVKLNCSNLTDAQKKAIALIPSLLKETMNNQSFLEDIKKRLDDISQQPTVTNNAPGGFATSGGTLINPKVYNILTDPGRVLPEDKAEHLVSELKKLPKGTALLVLHKPVDKEMNAYGGQLQAIFSAAGWDLPGTVIDISHQHITTNYGGTVVSNDPEGLHCVPDGTQLSKDLLSVLSEAGVHCKVSSSQFYPTPEPGFTLALFMGRNLE